MSFFLRTAILFLIATLIGASSCTKDEVDSIDEVQFTHLPKDVLVKLKELKLDPSDFNMIEIVEIDGSKNEMIVMGDMMISKERLIKTNANESVYISNRTKFIVDTKIHDVINLYVNTENTAYGLSKKTQEALRDAIKEYNEIPGTTIRFNAIFSSDNSRYNEKNYDVLVNVQPDLFSETDITGASEFPTKEGHPGEHFVLSVGANKASAKNYNSLKHLIMHGLGHVIGFRHVDWATRSSCVRHEFQKEESKEDVVIYISRMFSSMSPQFDSVMNACWRETEGKFSTSDKKAIKSRYPLRSPLLN
ncbi:dual-action HEIGH metallo-peptidase [Aquimarina sp. MAR_2010_214]|uniref:M57 family metalloprotease n=1 Tax=Aquimarina sp. MAR_2010_214 TaxID=1250026 RepID=UPI000C7147E8|nr:M57 family metalloprotease [Aquimarina sp. MAR_2010_214]PKV49034.1 dual-action HEIGH metallo-peptidase [Aquimarina sp. MAR_2010_214]